MAANLKVALRKEIKKKISSLDIKDKVRQSGVIYKKVISHDVYKKCHRISIYLSMPNSEVDTIPLLADALDSGKQCFVPRYVGDAMDMLRVHSMEDYLALPTTRWNIKQPADDDPSREEALVTGGLDLILVPGLAFTAGGKRLGRGRGFYDRYILQSRQLFPDNPPYTLALAFNEQLVVDLPTHDADMQLDQVLTAGSQ